MLLQEIFGFNITRKPNAPQKHRKVLSLIRHIRGWASSDTSDLTKEIFTRGDCGRMFRILQQTFPEAKAYWDKKTIHVLTDIDGNLYDITGSLGKRDDYPRPLKQMSKAELEDVYCRYSFKDRGPSW